jgi:hypothetical protein
MKPTEMKNRQQYGRIMGIKRKSPTSRIHNIGNPVAIAFSDIASDMRKEFKVFPKEGRYISHYTLFMKVEKDLTEINTHEKEITP